MNLNLNGLLGRIVYAVAIGVVTFVVLLIIAYIIKLFPVVAGVGDILSKFAYLLALLAGLVAFFTGGNFWHRTA
jgi:hypothetical protein